jgi:hypothetical protein
VLLAQDLQHIRAHAEALPPLPHARTAVHQSQSLFSFT